MITFCLQYPGRTYNGYEECSTALCKRNKSTFTAVHASTASSKYSRVFLSQPTQAGCSFFCKSLYCCNRRLYIHLFQYKTVNRVFQVETLPLEYCCNCIAVELKIININNITVLQILEETIQKKVPKSLLKKSGTRDVEKYRLNFNIAESVSNNLFQYRTKFVQHMLTSPMYANSAVGKPWEMIGR